MKSFNVEVTVVLRVDAQSIEVAEKTAASLGDEWSRWAGGGCGQQFGTFNWKGRGFHTHPPVFMQEFKHIDDPL